MNFDHQKLADAIKARRLQLNYTQHYCAYKLNISQNGYSKIELGYTQLSLERFLEICQVLETDVAGLLVAENGTPIAPIGLAS